MYSSGATAGIAIGCAFASAAIVSALFLLIRQPKPRQPKPQPVIWPPESRTKAALTYLPQGIGHDELRQDFSGLETEVDNFVFNFFHAKPVPSETVNADKLSFLLGGATDNDSNTQYLLTRLCDTSTRTSALRSYIARVLFARIDPRCVAQTTLLPVDVVGCYQATLLGEHGRRE